MNNYLEDKDFLKRLDLDNNKFYSVKIDVLDNDENFIQSIEGKVQPGSSISINGSSTIRRTCNINFIAEAAENDLTNVDNLLSINKRIKIFTILKNNIDSRYDKDIKFPLGVYIINQPNITHNLTNCIISLSCKDKMCLLDGSCGGKLPTSITFDNYDQVIGLQQMSQDPRKIIWYDRNTGERIKGTFPNDYTVYKYNNKYYVWTPEESWEEISESQTKEIVGSTVTVRQRFYDIIYTLVNNYGKEASNKIYINDVPLDIKQLVRYTGTVPLYFIYETSKYTMNESEVNIQDPSTYQKFLYNEDIGYYYTDFTYPGSLVSSLGDSVASVLTKIKNTLGNYEFFYDVEGNFVFQEIKNYLNTSYDPTDKFRLDNDGKVDGEGRRVEVESYGLSIINDTNYELDSYSNTKSVYTFDEQTGLIISYQNTPSYENVKNDFHIWGKKDKSMPIHYHLVVKEKPLESDYSQKTREVVYLKKNGLYTGGLRLAEPADRGTEGYDSSYTAKDWRAELYLQGLEAKKEQRRPDIYQQELLDLFDMIYDFQKKAFKVDIINNVNELSYWFDYLEPQGSFTQYGVDYIGNRLETYQMDKINKLYTRYVPNLILLSTGMDREERERLEKRCRYEGQPYSNISASLASNIAIGTYGYTAQDSARELLYQHTNYNESISIQAVPIYYLDVNTRITVNDPQSNIYGDYIIKSINLPIAPTGGMSISATRALERI